MRFIRLLATQLQNDADERSPHVAGDSTEVIFTEMGMSPCRFCIKFADALMKGSESKCHLLWSTYCIG